MAFDCVVGKTVCTVVTLGNWEWFSEWENERVMKRGDEYQTLKTAIGRRMWNQVCAIYPQLADKVTIFSVLMQISVCIAVWQFSDWLSMQTV